jgi:spore coat protein H
MIPRIRLPALAVCAVLLAVSCGTEGAAPATSPPAQEPSTPVETSVPPPEPSAPAETSEPVDTESPTTLPSTTVLPSFSEQSALLFDQAVLHEIAIEISDENAALLDPPTDDRVPVRLTIDGNTVDDAGLRLKRGLGQFQPFDYKPGLSIETDEFVDGSTIFDVDRFTLGNATWDHSFVNEPLIYAVYEAAGIPAPRTALARVTVNGETFGIYVLRETYKDRMLAQHFADPTGNLYELAGVPEDPDMGLELRTNQSDNDTSDLTALIELAESASDDEFRAAIEELVDVDELMTYWAIEALVGHHDGYAYDLGVPGLFPDAIHPPNDPISIPNNYYMYHDPTTDRFVFLPHGTDIALGMGAWSTYEVGPWAPVLLPPKADATIASRLWDDPSFRDDFAERVGWVLDEVWDAPALIAQADRLAELIRADGLTGSREFVTMAEFERSLADRKDFVSRRAESVRAELAAWESASTLGEES